MAILDLYSVLPQWLQTRHVGQTCLSNSDSEKPNIYIYAKYMCLLIFTDLYIYIHINVADYIHFKQKIIYQSTAIVTINL